MFPFNTPYTYLLHWALVCAAAPWLYSYFNEQHRQSSMTVEQAMLKAWERVITQPTIRFRKVIVGINCNVDVIVSGIDMISRLNLSSEAIGDKEVLNGLDDLYEAFAHFFSKGAPAERKMSTKEEELQLHDDEGVSVNRKRRRDKEAATKLEAVKWACALTTATDGSEDDQITCFKPGGSIETRGLDILRRIRFQRAARDGRNDSEEAGLSEDEEDREELENIDDEDALFLVDD